MRRGAAWLLAATVLLPDVVLAHERFVKHNLKYPLHLEYFRQTPGALLGLNPNMRQIGSVAFALLAAFLILWFFRQRINAFVDRAVQARLPGEPQRIVHELASFVMDKPVRLGWFHALGEWAVILFLRSPALVLMYSATNDSLVMPSYPLEPTSATFFKFVQVGLGLLILTQAFLPLSGALVLGTWLYLFRWGWMVAVDALPVVTVAAVYVSSPWQSHKLAITQLNRRQMRWVRLILGFGFAALGWFKLYNHNLTAGVADNYPWVMNDPLLAFFTMGTDPTFRRENWIVSFGLAEVLSGFMIMTGVFTRFWCLVMLWVFTKLMLVDFGWDEIPHIYPIGALMAVMFSNKLDTEFSRVEALERKAAERGKVVGQFAVVVAASLAIALLAVLPILYLLTFADRSNL
jgi:uncharacterized membrane protein YphA (DoxX/SURF4 family)